MPAMNLNARRDASDDLYANHDVGFIAVLSVCMALALFGVSIRVIAKRVAKRLFSVDDYLLIASLVVFVADSIMLCWGTKGAGIGHRAAALSDRELELDLRVLFADSFLQPTILLLAKMSILVLYYEIFVTRSFRLLVYALSFFVVAWWFATVFGNLFLCWPIEARFTLNKPSTCGDFTKFNVATPIPWIATDLAILIAPLPMIAKMHMSARRKAAVAIPFAVGGLSCVASVVRYTYVFNYQTDLPWLVIPHLEWHAIESAITILAVSLVISKPLVKRILPDWLLEKMRRVLYRRQPSTYVNMEQRRFGPTRTPHQETTAATF